MCNCACECVRPGRVLSFAVDKLFIACLCNDSFSFAILQSCSLPVFFLLVRCSFASSRATKIVLNDFSPIALARSCFVLRVHVMHQTKMYVLRWNAYNIRCRWKSQIFSSRKRVNEWDWERKFINIYIRNVYRLCALKIALFKSYNI